MAQEQTPRTEQGNDDPKGLSPRHCMEILSHFDGFISLCTEDYRLEYMNDRLQRRRGDAAADGKCYEILHGLDKPCSWCVMGRVLAGETVNWQVRSPRDGRWYQVISFPWKDAQGKIVGKQDIVRDITGQRDAEDALAAEMSKINTIISAIGDGITAIDTGFRVFYQNAIHQERHGRAIGELCFEAFQGRDAPCPDCQLIQSFIKGGLCRRERTEQRAEGSLHLEITASPLRDSEGRIVGGVEIVRDITERKRSEEARQKSEENLRLILDSAGEGIYAIDLEGRCMSCNPAAARMLGYDLPEELLGRQMHELLHHSRPDRTPYDWKDCHIYRVLQEGSCCVIEDEVFWCKDGSSIPVEYHTHPILQEGQVIGAVILFSDISRRVHTERKLRENQSRLKYLAYHDPLTTLPNRILFQDRLQHALGQARRTNRKVAILFLDLDRFKNINDSLGHETGDQLLCEVAARLRGWVREADTVARLGGDEFLVLLENLEDLAHVGTVARKIQDGMSHPISLGGHELSVTSSIGISIFPDDAADAEGLLKGADVAMYKAKDNGRNAYQFYRPEMNAHVHEMLLLENHLRKALVRNEFVLHYQPQYDLITREPIGVEALLRWNHPEKGLLLPGKFIQLAEETGMILSIGEWVLTEACRQARRWQDAGLFLRMAVNISGIQFKQTDFVDSVEKALALSGLEARWLELEITESVIMKNVESTILTLTDLKMRGVQLSVDDFGTGYSSLSYLKRFPINKLKIDRSFIKEVQKDPNDAAIVTSIIALSRSMGLDAIAEGIESLEHVEFLTSNQCLWGQGFLLSHPLPVEQIEDLLLGQKGTSLP